LSVARIQKFVKLFHAVKNIEFKNIR